MDGKMIYACYRDQEYLDLLESVARNVPTDVYLDQTNFSQLANYIALTDLFRYLDLHNDPVFLHFCRKNQFIPITEHPANISWLQSVEKEYNRYLKLKEDERKVENYGKDTPNCLFPTIDYNYFSGRSVYLLTPVNKDALCDVVLFFEETSSKLYTNAELRARVFSELCRYFGYHRVIQFNFLPLLLQ